jgi:hypothetical protein
MRHPAPALLLILISVTALTCVCGLAHALPQPRYQIARQHWEQRRPRHYVLDASWDDGLGAAQRVHLEMRDRRAVAGTNRDTGRPLSPLQLTLAARYVSVDALFETIATASRPPLHWHDQLVHAVPQLAPWIGACARPRPDVRYDPKLGYPVRLDLRGDPCTARLLYQSDLRIRIERLQPLPE